MNCSTERTFRTSSDCYLSFGNYKDEASLRVNDRNSLETVAVQGFSASQLRTALNSYVSGLKYHDNEAAPVLEFVQELQIQCKDVIERLSKEQSETTAN